MQRLTKELTLMSSLLVAATLVESQELDFNLARRSGVVINSIDSLIRPMVTSGDVADEYAQEVDLDPDQNNLWQGTPLLGDDLDMDSSRLIRHEWTFISRNGTAEAVSTPCSIMQQDYRRLPLEERPLSITNLRHNAGLLRTTGSGSYSGLFVIKYIIVELTLNELGIINAGRR